jgi:hypothetical protein
VSLTPADIAAADLGAPIDEKGREGPLERIKAATLVQAGDGRYAVATGDPSTPGAEGFVRTGKPGDQVLTFMLDFKRLAPVLRQRRPDLFLGGK